MPLYRYFCNDCNLQFEEIRKYEERDDEVACSDCKSVNTDRVVAVPFGIGTKLDPKKDTIYSPKEIDKVVGAESEKKWEGYDQRWKKRYEEKRKRRWSKMGVEPSEINMPKDIDGRYSPVMHLGGKKEREFRKDYSEALQEHRAERERKGLKQFEGSQDRDSVVRVKPKSK